MVEDAAEPVQSLRRTDRFGFKAQKKKVRIKEKKKLLKEKMLD